MYLSPASNASTFEPKLEYLEALIVSPILNGSDRNIRRFLENYNGAVVAISLDSGQRMFFTRLGTIAAWLALIMAAGRIGIAIYVITNIPNAEEARAWAGRYLGTSPAQAIDQAAIVVACAIALGILVEISRAVRRAN